MWFVLLSSLFLVNLGPVSWSEKEVKDCGVVCYTVVKSGSYLLGALLELFGIDHRIEHLLYLDELQKFLDGEQKGIILIRDPRDVAVSRVYWHTNRWFDPGPHGKDLDGKVMYLDMNQLEHWNNASFNEKLTMTLAHTLPLPYSQINREYELAAQALATGRGFLVRFEDLVGSKGGGSDKVQDRTIRKILAFLDYNITESVIQEVKNELFGNPYSMTYRQGQIGSWKTHFQPDHIRLCKITMGKTLLEWGYEFDYQW